MSDLLSWLKTTIEGDKAAAEKVRAEVWTAYEEPWEKGEWALIKVGETGRDGDSCGCCTTGCLDPDRAVHMAIHDPRDTIARCTAELAFLDAMMSVVDALDDIAYGEGQGAADPGRPGEVLYGPSTYLLKKFALGYRHRPGFNPEWVSD